MRPSHLLALAAVLLALGFSQMGGSLVLSKVAMPTCGTDVPAGSLLQAGGGPAEGPTRLCVCVSDGKATDAGASLAYQWCSITGTHGQPVSCTGGSTTVCP